MAREKEQIFLTVKEFSRIIGVPQTRTRRWLREGLINGTKVSRSWLVHVKEIERLKKK